ncbi:MAG: Crp/Fnr family transcriptional regulator [Candidatus Saccharibacteria bacterium]|nr:Crp/Fnr family transcriptional regulator [Candidatus Saccharibacteria bacterium]
MIKTSTLAGMPTKKAKDESIVAHFSSGKLMKFKKEETVINGIDEPKGVYLIKSGFVKSYSVSQAGHGNLLLIHQAGEFIPIPWALDGAHKTGLYYVAMTDVAILRASKYKLRTAMGSDVWLSAEILKQAVNIIMVYTQRIQTLEFRSARGRIISELLALAERFGEKHGKEVLINAPITHQDIADSINMNRETASRALEILFVEGLVGQKKHLISLLDLPKLQIALK